MAATRRDKAIFLASLPLLVTAYIAAAVGDAVRKLPTDIRGHWENLKVRGR